MSHKMLGHGPGGLLAPAVQRPVMVAQSWGIPSRFGVAQEENCFHQDCPRKSF
jgi:hypothetical protein